ncbi:PTS transporter subunit IIC [Clostridium brassicae]|uniref:PTS sugar transporter subunit IIC n=1 Tax=Clostridium brassicae TaxID=2999072 RepID=A0ABT4D9V3_9CLOT|nr:PTS sugar transporter subunit IIC [Clostridium brassicae]MCY6959067.1 PTS sugar transporter subunit IIC [Clostridium brassicae]
MKKYRDITKKILNRYLIKALSFMALGLFSSLIIGLILSQISKIPGFEFIKMFTDIISAKSPVVGSSIGVAIAYGLECSPLTIFSSAATGAFGYTLGGPVGAYIASTFGAEIGELIAGKTKIDIILVPSITIISGSLSGKFVGPYISSFMTNLGNTITIATNLHPIPMGVIVATLMGIALTAPISSAAIAISLNMSGLAAGAATVGCCAQMIGFAVSSYRENKFSGLISQGIGTSMLQVPNIFKNPLILIPPTLTGAILGPVSTTILKLENIPIGAGMGTSGLVGPLCTFKAMEYSLDFKSLLFRIALLEFIAPAFLSIIFSEFMRKKGWIKFEDMKLNI